jgi:hypothetical protein
MNNINPIRSSHLYEQFELISMIQSRITIDSSPPAATATTTAAANIQHPTSNRNRTHFQTLKTVKTLKTFTI